MALVSKALRMKEHKNGQRGENYIKITTKAVVPFSDNVISDFVDNKVADINTINKQETGTICTSCKIENLLECPTKRLCRTGDCKFHSTPDLLTRSCPNGICDKIRDEIINHHRYLSPSWKNTRAEEWCTNSWQIAKCFFPPDGYINDCNSGDTDFNGVISLIINCTLFETYFNDNLGKKGNVCDKAREVGRFIRHAPLHSVSDTELLQCFDALVALLSDITHQKSLPQITRALKKLTKLKASPYHISNEDKIAVESSSSNESLSKRQSDCLREAVLMQNTSLDTCGGLSNVEDGPETDRDNLRRLSSSLSTEHCQEDSHVEISTADQNVQYEVKTSPYLMSNEDKIEVESLKSSSSDESSFTRHYDCQKGAVSKEDTFWDTREGSSNVDDGRRETDRDSLGKSSLSLLSELCQQDDHVEISTADQNVQYEMTGSNSSVRDYSPATRGSVAKASVLSVMLGCLFVILMACVTIPIQLCTQMNDANANNNRHVVLFWIMIFFCNIIIRLNLALPLLLGFIGNDSSYQEAASIIILNDFMQILLYLWRVKVFCIRRGLLKFGISRGLSPAICYILVVFMSKELITSKDQMDDIKILHGLFTFNVVECRNETAFPYHNVTDAVSEKNKIKHCLRLFGIDVQLNINLILTVVLMAAVCGVYELLRRRLRRISFECVLETVFEKLYHTSEEDTRVESSSFKLKFWAVLYGMTIGILRLDHIAVIDCCYHQVKCKNVCLKSVSEYCLLGSYISSVLLGTLFSLILLNDKNLPACTISAILGSLSFVLSILITLVIERVSKLGAIQRYL